VFDGRRLQDPLSGLLQQPASLLPCGIGCLEQTSLDANITRGSHLLVQAVGVHPTLAHMP
jgi:hypothetical protein